MKGIVRFFLYVAIFMVLAVSSSYITFRIIASGRTVTVPDLRGKTILEANKLLSEKRLFLKVQAETYSPDVPKGSIVTQDIPPMKRIKEGRTIRVMVSKGPKRLYIPNFVGLNLTEARELAAKNNLRIQSIIRAHSASYDRGIVIAQRPAPDEKGSDTVTLLVSLGSYRQEYVCPDFTEMSLEETKALADALGLEIELQGYGSEIVGQKPSPGSIIKSGDVVVLELQHRQEHELRWL